MSPVWLMKHQINYFVLSNLYLLKELQEEVSQIHGLHQMSDGKLGHTRLNHSYIVKYKVI